MLSKELSRRQHGMEALLRIGALAVQGLDTATFTERALDCIVERLRGAAAVLVLEDEDGTQTPGARGDAALAQRLAALGRAALADAARLDPEQSIRLGDAAEPFCAHAALVPGVRKPLGILCLAQPSVHPVPADANDLLVAYARVIGVALQKLILGESLEQNLIDTISSFVNALESKDIVPEGPLRPRLAVCRGDRQGPRAVPRADIGVIRRVGILHDLGKIVVLDSILQKPSRLTAEEFALMKGHPASAAKILKPLRFLSEETEAIKRHHERYDGKGYPDGLKGEEIPLASRIVTVADSFDAMTSNRPYRDAMSIETAMEEIRRHSGAQFDPRVTDAFASVPLARLGEISRFENAAPPASEASLSRASPPRGSGSPRSGARTRHQPGARVAAEVPSADPVRSGAVSGPAAGDRAAPPGHRAAPPRRRFPDAEVPAIEYDHDRDGWMAAPLGSLAGRLGASLATSAPSAARWLARRRLALETGERRSSAFAGESLPTAAASPEC